MDLSAYPWLYLRDDRALGSREKVVELIAVGDVMLGRGVRHNEQVFQGGAPWLQAADLTIGNLECVLDAGQKNHRAPSTGAGLAGMELLLRAPASAAAQLRGAGFDVLGLANNHALDAGPSGLEETVALLKRAGMATVGAGRDREAALQPHLVEVNGVRIALLAFSEIPAPGSTGQDAGWGVARWDDERVEAAVKAARERADAVIVSVHWGYEYQTRVDPAQRRAAQLLFEAGADLVLGHHPHVVQPLDVDDGRCVAYSLGNFVFDGASAETRQGLALRAFFDRRGLRAVQALPVDSGLRSRLMPRERAETLMERITPRHVLRFVCGGRACRAIAEQERSAEESVSSLFWGGRIDLTGDGVPEHVRRAEEQVVIYSGEVEAWRSPRAWRVVDAALGDPNADGRGEILLALWKRGLDGLEAPNPEKERQERSRPFIIGHRGGVYRTLWGGSAVSRPIHEVELGDVDRDGAEDLVVLEAEGAGERTVAFWHWHGWGFSLIWRSEPGRYRDLVVTEDGIIRVAVE